MVYACAKRLTRSIESLVHSSWRRYCCGLQIQQVDASRVWAPQGWPIRRWAGGSLVGGAISSPPPYQKDPPTRVSPRSAPQTGLPFGPSRSTPPAAALAVWHPREGSGAHPAFATGGGGTPPRRPRHPQHAQPALLYTPVAEGCVRACPGGGPAAARRTRRPLGQALSSLSLPSDTFSSSTAPCPLPPSRWLLGFASAFPNLAPHSSTLSAPPPPSPSPLLA